MEKCTIKLSGTNDGRNYGGKSLWHQKKPYGKKAESFVISKTNKREWHAKVPELNLITRQQKSRFLTGGQLLAFHAFTNGS